MPFEGLKVRVDNDFHDAATVCINEAISSRSDASHFS